MIRSALFGTSLKLCFASAAFRMSHEKGCLDASLDDLVIAEPTNLGAWRITAPPFWSILYHSMIRGKIAWYCLFTVVFFFCLHVVVTYMYMQWPIPDLIKASGTVAIKVSEAGQLRHGFKHLQTSSNKINFKIVLVLSIIILYSPQKSVHETVHNSELCQLWKMRRNSEVDGGSCKTLWPRHRATFLAAGQADGLSMVPAGSQLFLVVHLVSAATYYYILLAAIWMMRCTQCHLQRMFKIPE